MKVYLHDVFTGSLINDPVEFSEVPAQGDEVRLADGRVLQIKRRVWAVGGDQARALELYLGEPMDQYMYDVR